MAEDRRRRRDPGTRLGITQTELPASACPECGATLDCSSSTHGRAPNPGDYGLCFYCASVIRFGAGMRPVTVTSAELSRLPVGMGDQLRRMQRLIRASHRGHLPDE